MLTLSGNIKIRKVETRKTKKIEGIIEQWLYLANYLRKRFTENIGIGHSLGDLTSRFFCFCIYLTKFVNCFALDCLNLIIDTDLKYERQFF